MDSIFESGDYENESDDSRAPRGRQTMQTIPLRDGGTLYIVGVAHISSQSAKDVVEVIEKIEPSAVLIELDAERFGSLTKNFDLGTFGAQAAQKVDSLQKVAQMTASGNLLYCLGSLLYAVAGCLMGTVPGGEFTAAARAARNVGARLILVDRGQRATLSRVWARVKTRGMKKDQPALLKSLECYLNETAEAGDNGLFEQVSEVTQDNTDAVKSSTEGQSFSLTGSLSEILKANCAHPNETLAAAKRLISSAMRPSSAGASDEAASCADLMLVRECGNRLVETQRREAMDEHSRFHEYPTSDQSMKLTIGLERDFILTRACRRAENESDGSKDIVAVVGAAHVQGMKRMWDFANRSDLNEVEAELHQPVPAECDEALKQSQRTQTVASLALAAGMPLLALRYKRATAIATGALVTLATGAAFSAASSVVAIARGLDNLVELDLKCSCDDHFRDDL